jgi:indole-3-glycerol phosphate synthase
MSGQTPVRGPLGEAILTVTATEPVFLVGEIKMRSPRDGRLVGDRDPATLASAMVAAGAGGISVVVEAEHFGGSLDLLETVADAVDVPVLAKGFFRTPADVDRAVAHGADAVLLISGDLSPDRRAAFVERCLDAGVSPLLETHTRAEGESATRSWGSTIGISSVWNWTTAASSGPSDWRRSSTTTP